MSNNTIFSIESFPPLPESINKINVLCSADNINLKELISVIESDPVLYTDILRFSNVPYHGFRYPITSISQAISLFGIAAIRGMALTAALKASPNADVSPYGISVNEWFRVMEQQQRFLDIWLGKTHRSMIQALGGLTFILEIGRLITSYALMFTKKQYQFSEHEPDKLAQEEINVIGSSGDELAGELFKFWNFDSLFFDSIGNTINPDNGLEPKICAALKCARTLFTLQGIKPFEYAEIILEKFGFSVSDARLAYEILLAIEDE